MNPLDFIPGGVRRKVRKLFGSGPDAIMNFHTGQFNTATRVASMNEREKLYDNTIYFPAGRGGMMETIIQHELGRKYDPKRCHLIGYCNPVRQIVDIYQNVFPGTWGRGLAAADSVDGKPINSKLPDALRSIWKWSNMDTQKQNLLRMGANLGTVGLRIVATPADNGSAGRVRIVVDHPARIVDFQEDNAGNVTGVLLRYETRQAGNLGDSPRTVEVEEILTNEEFSIKVDGVETVPDDQRANALGVCPYIIVRHLDNGERFGVHAYQGSEPVIHAINWIISRNEKTIDRHMFPKWFATAGGPVPKNFDLGEESVAYVKSEPDTPPPSFQALVPNINYADTLAFWQALESRLRERQPEMILADMKLLSGVSGETLAKVLKPTEDAILRVRPGYDHAMIRATQIGISWGVLLNLWELGTGQGTADAAQRAYESGAEDWEFSERPALPQTTYDQTQSATVATAKRAAQFDLSGKAPDAVSEAERLRLAGYTDAQIAAIQAEKSTQDVIPTEPL